MHELSSTALEITPCFAGESRKAPTRVRLAVVTSHPIQYATPLYAYLNRDPELEVTVLFCSDISLRGAEDPGFGRPVAWDVDLLHGYTAVFLGERASARSKAGFWSLVCPELILELRKSRYDVVWIHGQQFAAYVLAFALAKLQGIPVMTRADSHLGLSRTRLRKHMRNLVLSLQYRFIDRFLAVGTSNHDYYRALGVPEERIFRVPFSVDNERFMAASTLTDEQRAEVRASFGVYDERPILLYASKLLPRKHPDDLLRAAALLGARGYLVHVLIVGSGSMGAELEALASELRLDNVSFIGFVNQSELPRIYASSDVFVLPAENEPWALVVNEVMCAGLPVVLGATVGCVPDLVKEGANGFTCIAGEPASLASALEPLVRDAALRRRMGNESRRRISEWGYEQCRQGIRAAVSAFTAPARENA
jgi:glycosyltransferase involved in cell wall biosynthesis